jgi:Tfp pilus assembly protein PilX
MFTRIRDDERGIAMVVAFMVMAVVLMLAVEVFGSAIHNTRQSTNDRKRLQSVDAAEAGLDYYYNCLEHTQAASVDTCAATGSIAAAPGNPTFTITPTYYSDATGTTVTTGPFSDTTTPQSVKVVSVGTTNGRTTRTMESFMALTPFFGGFAGAVVSDNSVSLVNSFVINGNNILDGDIIVNCEDAQASCNAVLSSGNQTIKGSIYVPRGTLTISAGVHIYGSVWANGAVIINHPQALVDHDVTSSASSVSVPVGNVTGVATYCTGSAPSSSTVHGGIVSKCQGPPTTPSFPHLTYNDTAAPSADAFWTTGCGKTPLTDCYKLVQFGSIGDSGASGCTAARTYVEGTGSGTFDRGAGVPSGYSGVIVRILSTCTYNSGNNASITVGADLAIVSNGSIQLSQQSTWTGTNGNRKMFLMVPWPQSTCPTGDVTVGNNTNFNSLIAVGLYTPCTAHMSNQNAFYGQVVGGTVDIGNNWNMNFRPIVFPGAHVSGFKQDIAYIREIA